LANGALPLRPRRGAAPAPRPGEKGLGSPCPQPHPTITAATRLHILPISPAQDRLRSLRRMARPSAILRLGPCQAGRSIVHVWSRPLAVVGVALGQAARLPSIGCRGALRVFGAVVIDTPKKKLPADWAAAVRAKMAAAEAVVKQEVARVVADGTVTKEEAKQVRDVARAQRPGKGHKKGDKKPA
jgi:hypothetical protein